MSVTLPVRYSKDVGSFRKAAMVAVLVLVTLLTAMLGLAFVAPAIVVPTVRRRSSRIEVPQPAPHRVLRPTSSWHIPYGSERVELPQVIRPAEHFDAGTAWGARGPSRSG